MRLQAKPHTPHLPSGTRPYFKSAPARYSLLSTAGVFLLWILSCASTFAAAESENVLATLRHGHPRLMLTDKAMDDIRRLVKNDPLAAQLHQTLLASADGMLDDPLPVHKLRDGRRLLYVSREVLGHVTNLGYAFRSTGKQEYARRLWQEVDTAAGFKDWNPDHFLDTAEMTLALALAYDWLWDQWTPQQRKTLRDAIIRHGLHPALEVYQGKRKWAWHKVDFNWNQVCNGGIAIGALAIAEEDTALAAQILSEAVASIPLAMRAFAPDGAGKEGVGYWDYGSCYNVLLLDALHSAIGTDFGLGQVDGFRQSGDYQIYLSGAGKRGFDFSDCPLSPISTPQHLWMGRHYRIPHYTAFRYQALRGGQKGQVWDLLWMDAGAREATMSDLMPDRHFRGAECAVMRDSFADDSGFIAAMQGGENHGGHRHFDLGSFILEADGVRWIIDSGKEPETYQNHVNHTPREHFYRIRAEGHNTLVINPDAGPGQSPVGKAGFTSFISEKDRVRAVLDLSHAYAGQAASVTRTFELVRGGIFTVSDVIRCEQPSDVWLFFHTGAQVTLGPDKRSARLSQDGKSLDVLLGSPADAVFAILPAEPGPRSPKPAKQESNRHRRKLAVQLKVEGQTGVSVAFTRPAVHTDR